MGVHGRLQRFVAVTALLVWTLSGSKAYDTMWSIPTTACSGTQRNPSNGNKVVVFRATTFGRFPHIANGEAKNGGIPQKVDMKAHLEALKLDVESAIPDFAFNGPAVIALDAWHPAYNRNVEKLQKYKTASLDFISTQKPWLRHNLPEAMQTFEDAAVKLLLETIRECKGLRPNAKWGFFGIPSCFFFHSDDSGTLEWCKESQRENNDMLASVMQESPALYPLFQAERGMLRGWEKRGPIEVPIITQHSFLHVRAIMNETSRFNANNAKPVFSYIQMEEDLTVEKAPYINEKDVCEGFKVARELGAQDTLFWAVRGCDEAKRFVTSNLGAASTQVTTVQKVCPEPSCWRSEGACA